ncbi:unnamed protein product, partial [Allacma fusca]
GEGDAEGSSAGVSEDNSAEW